MGAGRTEGDSWSRQPFVHRGRSVVVGFLSLVTLAVLGLYLFGGSAAPSLASQYLPSARAIGIVEGTVQWPGSGSSTSRKVAVEFRDSGGNVLGQAVPRLLDGARFRVPIREGAQTVAVTISSGHAVVRQQYRVRSYAVLQLRARFPGGGSALVPAVFPQMG
jgi:hypothetical protein